MSIYFLIFFLNFTGGISISGTAFNCWTQTENSLEKAKQVGALMGCPTRNIKEMIRCLRYRPARAVVETLADFMVYLYGRYMVLYYFIHHINVIFNSKLII